VEKISTFMAGKAPDTIRKTVVTLKDLIRLSGEYSESRLDLQAVQRHGGRDKDFALCAS